MRFWGQSHSRGLYQPTYQRARRGSIHFLTLPINFARCVDSKFCWLFFSGATLEINCLMSLPLENYSYLATIYVRDQTSVRIFAPNGGCCLFIPLTWYPTGPRGPTKWKTTDYDMEIMNQVANSCAAHISFLNRVITKSTNGFVKGSQSSYVLVWNISIEHQFYPNIWKHDVSGRDSHFDGIVSSYMKQGDYSRCSRYTYLNIVSNLV